MKAPEMKTAIKHIFATGITILIILLVWWGMHFPGLIPPSANADTFTINCSPTPDPTPITDGTPTPAPTYVTPSPYPTPAPLETMPPSYQNPNNAQMAWIQYGGDGNHPKPGVLVIHGTWHAGSATDVLGETQDIANAGFFAASVFFELAPNPTPVDGYIPGQPSHELDGTTAGWRMNLEVNDIKNYVNAMRADARCNGWVAVVGGSAGATHAITVALDTNASGNNGNDWPKWMGVNGDTRPNCAVMLSATYDFADWTPSTGETQIDSDFVHYGMRDYAQVLNLDWTTLKNLPLNPVNLVPGAIALGFKPIYMINSYHDTPTAYHQLVTMVFLLQNSGLTFGVDYKYLTIPGSDGHLHSFQYWNTWDHISDPPVTVGQDVIGFLKLQAFGMP
jgi:hypothetical protein